MVDGFSLGPVFEFERLTRARRWQGYALRALFVLGLLAGMATTWASVRSDGKVMSTAELAQVGNGFFATITTLQLALVLLAAPAATAGAICLDRARGSLTHVLVTDLTDSEVVLGKLGARLVPVVSLVACALPVSALGTLMGGIDPMSLASSFLIAVGVAVLGCSMAMALSVWVGKTHEVMTVVFGVWALWLMPIVFVDAIFTPVPEWMIWTNPFALTMAPYDNPGTTSILEPILFLLACLAISGGLVGLTVAKVRAVTLRQSARVAKPAKLSKVADWARRQVRWARGPALDVNPVLWREWHRSRPSKITRAVWWIFAVVSVGSSALMIVMLEENVAAGTSAMIELPPLVIGGLATFGLLLLSASAATALSEERVRGSLDVLLSTPMKTRSIVFGKWWGTFRRAPWLVVCPTAVIFAMLPPDASFRQLVMVYGLPFLILAQGAAITSLGLAMATWVSRLGRAVTWTVALFVASSIGWPLAAFTLIPSATKEVVIATTGQKVEVSTESTFQMALACGSPCFNTFVPPLMLEEEVMMEDGDYRGVVIGVVAWTAAYALIASGLFLAVLLTFDRCLGRSPEAPRKPGRDPSRAASKAGVGELQEWQVDGLLVP